MPPFFRHLACLAGLAAWAWVSPARGQEVAGSALWRSFVETYGEFSLEPLEAGVLDEKAREALIATAGFRFREWQADAHPNVPEMAAALAAEDPRVSAFERIEKALVALMPKIDRYGSYRPAAEVSQWQEVARNNRGSVQMRLDQSPDGEIFCYPYDGGPADRAGILHGASLLRVGNLEAKGQSLGAVSLAFVGPPGAAVTVAIRQPQGIVEEFSLVRTDQPAPKITLRESPVGITLSIRSFDKDSARLVRDLMKPHANPGRLTIDLRGNPGGYRDEALKIASLFFAKGTHVGNFTTRHGKQNFTVGNDVSVDPGSISILQDERTASAAEYLIAALREGFPGKVTLFGSKTYGKSHSTATVMLDGGGSLTVTEALLATASGRSWDREGIQPD